MPILERIQSPADLRGLTRDELHTLADEIRARLIDVCSRTGGHIGAGLGVVELTIALHAAFETPRDQLVWDVGHQGYPHKLLTSRNDRLETLRQENGISGFLKRTCSAPDTRRRPSRPRSASRQGATCVTRTTKSSPSSATAR